MRPTRPSLGRAHDCALGPAFWLACSLTACASQSAPPAPIEPDYTTIEDPSRANPDAPEVTPLSPVAAMQQKLIQACEDISPDRIYMTGGSFGWYVSGLSDIQGIVDVLNPDAVPCFNTGGTGVIGFDGVVISRDTVARTRLRTFVADIPAWSIKNKRWAPATTFAENDIYTDVGCEIFSIAPFPDRPGVLLQCTDERWIDSDSLAEVTLPFKRGLVAVGVAGLTLWTVGADLVVAQDDRIVAHPVKLFPGLSSVERVLFRVARATEDGFLVVVEKGFVAHLVSVSSTGDATVMGTYAKDDHWIPATGGAVMGAIALDPEGSVYMRGGGYLNTVRRWTPDEQPATEVWNADYGIHGEKGSVFPVNRTGFMISGASGAR